ncbi:MAG TPA: hypothetical protein VFX49_05685 [Chloroflexota bacterium]|nr:hypothetical protein [Chloroflexota bacterium]
MARTLSDTLIIAVVEAATRLTGARGPIAGSSAANAQNAAVATPPAGEGTGTGATATAAPPAPSRGEGSGGQSGGEHDTRTAGQIAADFKTIYSQIEELVRASAEQETKAVGFSPR